jgi:hypothetical protein
MEQVFAAVTVKMGMIEQVVTTQPEEPEVENPQPEAEDGEDSDY